MRCDKKRMRLYAVTDRAWTGKQSLYQQVKSALKGGVTCLQLREKNLDKESFLHEAIEIQKLCSDYDVPLIINDHPDIAIACGADGVHVGQLDPKASEVRKIIGEKMILGVSAQTVEQAMQAQSGGADYLGVGAVFSTTTKLNTKAVSYETLQSICSSVAIPVVAIGGIHKENMLSLAGSGTDGVALVSAIFAAQNIEMECKTLRLLADRLVEA